MRNKKAIRISIAYLALLSQKVLMPRGGGFLSQKVLIPGGDISKKVLLPGGGVLSQKVLRPGDISKKVLLPRGGGSLAKKCSCLGTLAKKVLMPRAPPPTVPVDRRKDRNCENITLATCAIRMREVTIPILVDSVPEIGDLF